MYWLVLQIIALLSYILPGDIYIVGCTNVGKSTLFNTLIQSDLCKVQAVDLMQRATVSEWPGTTLNLLKVTIVIKAMPVNFPLDKVDGWLKGYLHQFLSDFGPQLLWLWITLQQCFFFSFQY